MNRSVVAQIDRSMLSDYPDYYDDDQELLPISKKKSNSSHTFLTETLGLKCVDYDLADLDINLLNETINFRHPISLLAIKDFKRYPNMLRLNALKLLSLIRTLGSYGEVKLINYHGFIDEIPDIFGLKVEHASGDSKKNIYVLLSEHGDLVPSQYPEYKDDVIGDKILYTEVVQFQFDPANLEAQRLCSEIEETCAVKISDDEVYIEMIIQTQQGLTTQRVRFESKYRNDLDLHYGDGFSQFHDKLVERLNSRDKGIVMFHGPPGNGKTHYIRRLLPDLNKGGKRVVLIPKHILESLESPAFNLFMIQHFVGQKIIFVMEDAESIIAKRTVDGGGRSQLVSTLLNITDGILNDIFSIQVILTFNTALTSIDEALLRKGRLIAKYEFKSIGRVKAEELARYLGVSLDGQPADKDEFSLAEIYALKETEEDELLINQNLDLKKDPLGF